MDGPWPHLLFPLAHCVDRLLGQVLMPHPTITNHSNTICQTEGQYDAQQKVSRPLSTAALAMLPSTFWRGPVITVLLAAVAVNKHTQAAGSLCAASTQASEPWLTMVWSSEFSAATIQAGSGGCLLRTQGSTQCNPLRRAED